MIRFKPCEDWHIVLIEAQDSQIGEKELGAGAVGNYVENSLALSCWIDDACVGAAGIRPVWPGRAVAWMLLGRGARPAMLAIARKLRFVLDTYPANRIEMTVRANFLPGCRLAALLGFGEEARLASFYPDGSAARLYARLRG
jgi:hypothetical protein